MYNSIHQFNTFGVKKIEEKVKEFIAEGKNLGELVIDIQEDLYELGRNIRVFDS